MVTDNPLRPQTLCDYWERERRPTTVEQTMAEGPREKDGYSPQGDCRVADAGDNVVLSLGLTSREDPPGREDR